MAVLRVGFFRSRGFGRAARFRSPPLPWLPEQLAVPVPRQERIEPSADPDPLAKR